MNPGFYALVGPNAAGKTHYLHTLMGPNAAFVPAGPDAKFAGATVTDHIRAARASRPLDPIEFPDARIDELSVGERRLLTLEVALAANKPLLLLDEPFDGIDTATRKRVRERLIDHISEDPQLTIVMSSHRSEDFRGLANHVIQVFDKSVSEPMLIDDLRRSFPTITGPADVIAELASQHRTIETSSLGPVAKAVFSEPVDTHLNCTYPDDAELIDLLATERIAR
ncbi:AAA family ATPase [Corynebacterium sp. Marseille-P4321]|uniref:AAA family ATPase n=1 Tax=Corynebacterium sp. Marseille-P4321 TaxID=2736603 RepID=UPI00158D6CD1|nr:AAA family ATPase [Corynebacterium sp. Marseille-P4321]